MATEERVLCFKRELFEKLGVFQGISLDVGKYFPDVTAQSNIKYISRGEAEQDRSHKQLIPYALIVCGDKILRYRRGKGGGETRLHGLYSVGVGGHISEEDTGIFAKGLGYHDAMRRELLEEVSIEVTKETAVAVINDDSTDVGYVHLGIVHIVQVADETLNGRCHGIVGAEFVPISEAVKNLDAYESWSRFCMEHLQELLDKAAAVAPESKVA